MALNRTDWLSHEVTRLADGWFRALCADPWTPLALFYRPSAPGRRGELRIAHEAPSPDFIEVTECHLHGGLTRDQGWWRINDATRRLPLLDPLDVGSERPATLGKSNRRAG